MPIVQHADVRAMLLQMRARTEAHRALTLFTAMQLDLSEHGSSDAERAAAQGHAQILLPVCKACGAELGFEVANLAVQVFGGHGYVADNGVEQYVRDVRVTSIYEGTTGIQALDLLQRKVLADDGGRLKVLLDVVRADLASGSGLLVSETGIAVQSLLDRTQDLVALRKSSPRDVEAAALAYLRMTGIVPGRLDVVPNDRGPARRPPAGSRQAGGGRILPTLLPAGSAACGHCGPGIGASALDPPGAV